MVVQAVNADKTQMVGFFVIGTETLSNSIPFRLDMLGMMYEELETAVGVNYYDYIWNITWALTLITPVVKDNPSRFISALPSYNLGVVTYEYFGTSTGSEFWNYTAQTFRANACLLVTTFNPAYPISGIPDSFPGTIDIQSTLPFVGFRNFEYATSVNVILQSADEIRSYGYANYRVQAIEEYNPFIASGF
jgi:hypothetical protein